MYILRLTCGDQRPDSPQPQVPPLVMRRIGPAISRSQRSGWLSPNATIEKDRAGMNKTSRGIRVEQGSGNVFRDLGFPHPEREQLKADLTLQIYRLIKQRGLTQAEAAEILGIRQPHVSALVRGRSEERRVGKECR